jgi:hypothetical protein
MTNNIETELFSLLKSFAGGGKIFLMKGIDKNRQQYSS